MTARTLGRPPMPEPLVRGLQDLRRDLEEYGLLPPAVNQ